jgi:hypothetical protein
MCDSWRQIAECLPAELRDAIGIRTATGAADFTAPQPPPRDERGVPSRLEWERTPAEAGASCQEPGEREEEPAKRLLSTMPSGKITATMSREPPHRPNAVVVIFPMRMDAHLPRSLYLIRSTTQASAISASVPRNTVH